MSPAGVERRRWATSLAIVLVLYALGVAAIVGGFTPAPAAPASAPPAALQVDLAALPEAPPVPRTDLAAGPAQQEQHRATPLPRPRPALALPPQPHPDGDASTTPPPPPATPDTPSDRHEVSQTQAPPDVPADAADRYAARQTVAGQRSDAPATWQGQLLGHLERHRRYPRGAERLRQQGVVHVRFAVDRHGNTRDIRIGQSSGYPLLDAETLDTVRRGSPVPAPPAEIAGDPVEVMVPVTFFIRAR